jgi:NAD-dependent dihydropyrimidine dehydrogenase PreA subunit
MTIRKIVNIDEDKCNGCGLCVPNCAEGAIKIIDGKAKLLAENLCDGLGACLGECPRGAISITEREADKFDEAAVHEHLNKKEEHVCSGHHEHHQHGGGCPGSMAREIKIRENPAKAAAVTSGDIEVKIKPQLTQWPVQLMLMPEKAPYFENADLLITADCVPFAYPNYHLDLLKGKKVVVGCPKLDDNSYYEEKLTNILKNNSINSVTVAFMEVPCCGGIVMAAERAVEMSGKNIPLSKIRIKINGEADELS